MYHLNNHFLDAVVSLIIITFKLDQLFHRFGTVLTKQATFWLTVTRFKSGRIENVKCHPVRDLRLTLTQDINAIECCGVEIYNL